MGCTSSVSPVSIPEMERPLSFKMELMDVKIVDDLHLRLGSLISLIEECRMTISDTKEELFFLSGVHIYKEPNFFRLGKSILRKLITDVGGDLTKLTINIFELGPYLEIQGVFSPLGQQCFNMYIHYISNLEKNGEKLEKYFSFAVFEESRLSTMQNALYYACMLENLGVDPNSKEAANFINKIQNNLKKLQKAILIAKEIGESIPIILEDLRKFLAFMNDPLKLKKIAEKCLDCSIKKINSPFEINYACVKKSNQSELGIETIKIQTKGRMVLKNQIIKQNKFPLKVPYSYFETETVKLYIVVCITIQSEHTGDEKLISELLKLYNLNLEIERDNFHNNDGEYSIYYKNKEGKIVVLFSNTQKINNPFCVCDNNVNNGNIKKIVGIIVQRHNEDKFK